MTDYSLPTGFTFISDPGHAWLVCSIEDVNAVDLSIFEFSNCSFVQDGVLFLEEDADATLFLLAYWVATGRKASITVTEVPHFNRAKPRLPGGMSFEERGQKCRALELLIASRKLAEDAA
jgi:hypothetical protein